MILLLFFFFSHLTGLTLISFSYLCGKQSSKIFQEPCVWVSCCCLQPHLLSSRSGGFAAFSSCSDSVSSVQCYLEAWRQLWEKKQFCINMGHSSYSVLHELVTSSVLPDVNVNWFSSLFPWWSIFKLCYWTVKKHRINVLGAWRRRKSCKIWKERFPYGQKEKCCRMDACNTYL